MEQQYEKQEPLLQVKDLQKHFRITNPLGKVTGHVKAVNHVTFDLFEKETLGLVGESGCGKSTTGRTILRLTEPTSGTALYKGQDIFSLKEKEFMPVRKEMQMIFQDPHSSLNPKKRIGFSIEEPMKIQGIGTKTERTDKAMDLLHKVGLRKDQYDRYPHEFSGGQRQRIGLARALAVTPKIIICDEPVSALDVSIQSQVMNLLQELQEEFGQAYLFIAHDLSVVRHISDRIGVMYLGNIVELAPTDQLFQNPLHPYTQALLSAIPIPNPRRKRERIVMKGDVPSPANLPSGCVFHTRCPYVMDRCKSEVPTTIQGANGHQVACHLHM
ncbi:peptide/nickel transport system ATP-binding protein/oligopeptide transport system ATP-binding protein [Bacillus thermophilus]|uniref:Peptide/nickel transport system ATP-binding protein/oligopeptide transport system ATP-binding protein n=1 Tax=Siminovitchia thermophila TaxID=1245522 RepID=A0ABS2RA31_9BACI|nr:dipeptide ABC transporter ATP-binding protein [Siminovitchia thermophila]MBM7715723.1 peptide/nickel transport system ATP-binding protein/oligopeptide transport system ATP-binding protein [Siminovitchia thermophila]ONK21304.1 peptide ABC transporter ATP-binding protein [Bacillus sp. VT-16-64]